MLTFIIIALCLASFGAGLLALPSLKAIIQGAWANRPSLNGPLALCAGLMGHDDQAEELWPGLFWALERAEARVTSWRRRPSREAVLFAALQRAALEITKRDAIIGIQDMTINRLRREADDLEVAGAKMSFELHGALRREAALARDLEGTLRELHAEEVAAARLRGDLRIAQGVRDGLIDANYKLRVRLADANFVADRANQNMEEARLAVQQLRARNRYLRGQLNQLGPYVMPKKTTQKPAQPAAIYVNA